MAPDRLSGQKPFAFAHRADLYSLPTAAQAQEVNLHGGFAVDPRPGQGQIYYGMPGCGILRVDPDLQRQEIIRLPNNLGDLNFHSTKIGQFDGKWRLFLPANDDQLVAVVTPEGAVDFILPRPVFEQYQSPDVPYKPTDTLLVGGELLIADGYGANYISGVDVATQRWTGIFGGKTDSPTEEGRFGTAHGLNFNPVHHHLDIADRPHSRIQAHGTDGHFIGSYKLPPGAWPCGISYAEYRGRWYAAIGCLLDPVEGRPAPIYILDAQSYELLSIIRPKEELGVELAQHLHNVLLYSHGGELYLVCQSWNPGHYFVLQAE